MERTQLLRLVLIMLFCRVSKSRLFPLHLDVKRGVVANIAK